MLDVKIMLFLYIKKVATVFLNDGSDLAIDIVPIKEKTMKTKRSFAENTHGIFKRSLSGPESSGFVYDDTTNTNLLKGFVLNM